MLCVMQQEDERRPSEPLGLMLAPRRRGRLGAVWNILVTEDSTIGEGGCVRWLLLICPVHRK